MSWTLLIGIILVLTICLVATISRRHELNQMAKSARQRAVSGTLRRAAQRVPQHGRLRLRLPIQELTLKIRIKRCEPEFPVCDPKAIN